AQTLRVACERMHDPQRTQKRLARYLVQVRTLAELTRDTVVLRQPNRNRNRSQSQRNLFITRLRGYGIRDELDQELLSRSALDDETASGGHLSMALGKLRAPLIVDPVWIAPVLPGRAERTAGGEHVVDQP